MKDVIKFLIEDFHNKYQDWDGDIIDLTEDDKDLLCYEWLKAYPSWLDDCLPACIIGQETQLYYLDMLYTKGTDDVSQLQKCFIYLEAEEALREKVQEHFCEAHMKAEPFAGYERGQ
jgi:hypothetical protein